MKKALLAAVAVLSLVGIAIAQVPQIPVVSSVQQNDLIQIVPGGNPSAGNKYATPAQINSQSGYYKSIPLTAFTYTFGNSTSYAAFNPGGTLDTGTITLARSPSDGARECIFSTQIVTSLTLNANTGQSIANAVSTLAANAGVCYLYSAANATWDRD